MVRTGSSLGLLRPRLLAVLIPCLAPAALSAETVVFRNECRSPVVVQAASVVRGVVVREKPHLLRSGDCTPRIKLDRDKVITVYDGRPPNRVLFQGALRASTTEHYYSIVPFGGRVRMQRRQAPPGGAMPGAAGGMGGLRGP